MVGKATGTFYRRENNQNFIYVPLSLVEDTYFPLKHGDKIKFTINGKNLKIEVKK